MNRAQEVAFLRVVFTLRALGYGRMMQLISHLWYHQAEEERKGTGAGAIIASMCVWELSKSGRQRYLDIYQQDIGIIEEAISDR